MAAVSDAVMSELVHLAADSLPVEGLGELVLLATFAREGKRAARRYIEFFTANIRTRTRAALMLGQPHLSSPGAIAWA